MAQMAIAKTAVKTMQLDSLAHGRLGPSTIGLSEVDMAEVHRLVQDDASYADASGLAPGCVDGRRDEFGACVAGGAATLAVGYIAAHGIQPGETIIGVFRRLTDLGYTIILHEHCGALRHFRAVMQALVRSDANVYKLLGQLGTPFSAEQKQALATLGKALPDNFIPQEDVLFKTVTAMGGRIEHFKKAGHREVETVYNKRAGKSFRREVLAHIASAPQVFVLDAWVIADAAARIAVSFEARQRAARAMAFYDCGVLLQLAAKDHEVETHL